LIGDLADKDDKKVGWKSISEKGSKQNPRHQIGSVQLFKNSLFAKNEKIFF
jgi:hypothetical protein